MDNRVRIARYVGDALEGSAVVAVRVYQIIIGKQLAS
jgi:hypothetical protein